jgi:FkbM family methyltransferase
MRRRRATLDWLMRLTRLELLPVRVAGGVAAGARWTLYPWSAYWRGHYEPGMHQTILALGDIRGWHCWDLGAHFGIYSVGLALRVGPTGSVAAFEPNPVSYARLARHQRLNRLTNLKLFEAAVSNEAGVAPLFTYGDMKSTTTHLPYEGEPAHAAARALDVSTVVLDDLVTRGDLKRPNFIKVDVEGHAHRALAGAKQTLADTAPLLIVGLHSDAEADGVLRLLESYGYDAQPLGCAPNTPVKAGQDVLFRRRR